MATSTTCWVLDHPAHCQLFHPLIKMGSPLDMFVVTSRPVVEQMVAEAAGITGSQCVSVQRPAGRRFLPLQRELFAWRRLRKVKAKLARRKRIGHPLNQVVSKGAPLELMAAKKAGVGRRVYLTDTEVNHVAHRLALGAATEVIVPSTWREHLDGGFLAGCQETGIPVTIIRGELPHVYLKQPHSRGAIESNQIPRVLHRTLRGGGIHDANEIVESRSVIADLGVEVTRLDEGQPASEVWRFPDMLGDYDGVVSESVTVAHEAVCLGVPTLLVSKAQRGFLDPHVGGGTLFQIESTVQGHAFDQTISAWRDAMMARKRGEHPSVGWSEAGVELRRLLLQQ